MLRIPLWKKLALTIRFYEFDLQTLYLRRSVKLASESVGKLSDAAQSLRRVLE